jgi:hypothetical protein
VLGGKMNVKFEHPAREHRQARLATEERRKFVLEPKVRVYVDANMTLLG